MLSRFPESDPLPTGWHRVTWTYMDHRKYVVTADISSAALLFSSLNLDPVMHDVKLFSWSDQLGGGI